MDNEAAPNNSSMTADALKITPICFLMTVVGCVALLELVGPEFWVAVGMLLIICWTHSVFIMSLVQRTIDHDDEGIIDAMLTKGIKGGTLLAIPVSIFGILDSMGSAYSCADGHAYDQTGVPMWPWLWIGWAFLVATALPIKLASHLSNSRVELRPLYIRALQALPLAALVWLFGFAFQDREVNCVGPFEGWGLFEGGAVLFPLLALFWFTAALSLAMLSKMALAQSTKHNA